MKRLGLLIATGLGSGLAPVAPGTFGSLVGIAAYVAVRGLPIGWQAAIILIISLAGIWAGNVAIEHFGSDDPGQVVVDEVAGQMLTLWATAATPLGIALGFLIFRALDVRKPWPARQLEGLHGGLGIMADDLMVAVYGNILIRVVQAVRPGLF
jgi:phosphatidylglycerophosphatase A